MGRRGRRILPALPAGLPPVPLARRGRREVVQADPGRLLSGGPRVSAQLGQHPDAERAVLRVHRDGGLWRRAVRGDRGDGGWDGRVCFLPFLFPNNEQNA